MNPKNSNPSVDRSYLNPGVRRLQELARQFNKDPNYRGIGASLGGVGSDAMIVAVGAAKALSEQDGPQAPIKGE